MDVALQRLLDEDAIKKVHLRYCRAIDRRDFDLLRTCYHPDAEDDHRVGWQTGRGATTKRGNPRRASKGSARPSAGSDR